jgi:uncharacterized protein (DUF433 family)
MPPQNIVSPLQQFTLQSPVLRKIVFHHKPIREPGQDISTLPTYTLPEAAAFLAISQRTLFSWYSSKNPVLKPSGSVGGMMLLSFRDLQEAYKVHILRSKEHFSLQYLRKAMTQARKEYGSQHPLIELGRDIAILDKLIVSTPRRGRQPRRSVALGSPETSPYFPEVVKAWGKRIVPMTRIYPWRYLKRDDTSRPVTLDPNVMSGRPVVTGTRIPVNILWGRIKAGEKVESIAKDYHLDAKRVRQALRHVDKKVA